MISASLAVLLAFSTASQTPPLALVPVRPQAAPAPVSSPPAAGTKIETEKIPGSAVEFDMVYIPGGRFRMGSPDDEPAREADEGPAKEVDVASFWLQRTEVTWDEYEQWYLSSDAPGSADAISRPTPSYGPHDRSLGRGRHVAMGMSWKAAMTYCEWLSKRTGKAYRLPTEAEWEYAARAGDAGAAPNPLGDFAWSKENSDFKPHVAGKKKPNAFGLCDMLGNVWEYCLEPYDAVAKAPKPSLRGGSFSDAAPALRYANRQVYLDKWNEKDPQRPRSLWWVVEGTQLGFRVARSAETK